MSSDLGLSLPRPLVNQAPDSSDLHDLWKQSERRIESDWQLELSSSREAIWPLLADTSRLNQSLGLPEMHFEEVAGRLHGSAGRGLLRQEWVEVPWEWEAARWLVAERHYSRGPALAVRVRYQLEEKPGGGTTLGVSFSWLPRSWWSPPVLRFFNRWLEARYRRAIAELDDLAGDPQTGSQSEIPEAGVKVDERRLRGAVDEMTDGKLSRGGADHLANLIRSGSDQQLFRIRPKQLAFEWGMELEDVLPVLLSATRAGLLRISWDVMCPHCRGVRQESRSLGELREFGRCDVCDIDFDATAIESIEVTFRVVEEVRAVREVFYCSAEPAKKPHILMQHSLAPGECYETRITFSPGRYRLRSAAGGGAKLSFEVGKGSGGDEVVTWRRDDPGGGMVPQAVNARAGLRLINPDKTSGAFVVLEKLAEDPAALRPSELFNLQQFRDLFSEESIASGLKLEVGHQTLLFTDIVGSSRLYSESGDIRAFNAVHGHFVSLREIVVANRGSVVRTIGDAMMAAFQRPADALAAAVEIQRHFDGGGEEELQLRASLHRGICLAVKLEANIDYFGAAVNHAAKIQSVAGARQIAVSEEFFAQLGIGELAGELGLDLSPVAFSAGSLGEGEPAKVWLASFAG